MNPKFNHVYVLKCLKVLSLFLILYYCRILQTNEIAVRDAFESCVIFLLLSPYDNHQSDMTHRLHLLLTKEAETPLIFNFAFSPVYLRALTLFTTKEIIPYPFEEQQEVKLMVLLKSLIITITLNTIYILDRVSPLH